MEQAAQNDYRQDMDTHPIYNIKAVVEATGLPASTLRAWERRYGALTPRRTDSGYRLYSAQDIALLRWLKLQVDAGMSISQAIELLHHKGVDDRIHTTSEYKREARPETSGMHAALVDALLIFDESRADRIMEEAFVLYGVETVAERIIAPTMVQIGDLWHRGMTSTTAEHFASNYLRRKVDAIISTAPKNADGPLIVMGCAPDDWHELGLLLLYLLLRRRGFNILYLGQSVPQAQFIEDMVRLRPRLVIISATTSHAASGLIDLAQAVQAMTPPRPVFAYGGRAFSSSPELRQRVPGVFLGESGRAAAEYVTALLDRPLVLKPGDVKV